MASEKAEMAMAARKDWVISLWRRGAEARYTSQPQGPAEGADQDAAAVDVVDNGKAPGPDEGEEHGQQIQKELSHPHTPQKSR